MSCLLCTVQSLIWTMNYSFACGFSYSAHHNNIWMRYKHLSDSFSHHLCAMKWMISLYAHYRRGGHDMEILKHLLIPSAQTEDCRAKFLQNTYICHTIRVSFSSTHGSYPQVSGQAPRKWGVQSWSPITWKHLLLNYIAHKMWWNKNVDSRRKEILRRSRGVKEGNQQKLRYSSRGTEAQ